MTSINYSYTIWEFLVGIFNACLLTIAQQEIKNLATVSEFVDNNVHGDICEL